MITDLKLVMVCAVAVELERQREVALRCGVQSEDAHVDIAVRLDVDAQQVGSRGASAADARQVTKKIGQRLTDELVQRLSYSRCKRTPDVLREQGTVGFDDTG